MKTRRCGQFALNDYTSPSAVRELAAGISEVLATRIDKIVCIGTDRSTGDSLGPIVGTMLEQRGLFNVLGTLDSPIHAENLKDVRLDPREVVLGIDACLGSSAEVGSIRVCKGSLRPGLGVHKQLPPIGDFFIAGTVNVGGFMEYMILQNTELGRVYRMAMIIADAICASGVCNSVYLRTGT